MVVVNIFMYTSFGITGRGYVSRWTDALNLVGQPQTWVHLLFRF